MRFLIRAALVKVTPMSLKTLRQLYHMVKSDRLKAFSLQWLERAGFRKDIVRLDTNDVCNIECIMCSNKPQKCTAGHYMPIEDYKVVIDWIARSTRLLYLSCSYEPLMTPHFDEYLAYARAKGVPFISLATNGMLLTEEICRSLVDEGIHELIFSFNGYTKDEYDRIMYRSKYDLVMKNLARLRDYKREKNSVLPHIRVNTILMKTNLRNFDAFVRFLDDFDVDHVQFRKFDDHAVNDPEAVKEEELTADVIEEMKPLIMCLQEEVKRLAERGREIIVPLGLYDEKRLAEKKPAGKKGICPIPFFSCWIDFRGQVRVCCGDNEGAVIGNILTDSQGDIVKKRSAFRKIALSGACAANCASNNLFESTIL